MNYSSLIDLTKEISESLEVFPGDPQVFIDTVSTSSDNFVLERLCMSTHAGTHIDAPFHVVEKGAHVDEILLRDLLLPALFFNVVGLNEDERLSAFQRSAENINGKALLIRTGQRVSANITEKEAALFISLNVKVIGVDAMSVEESQDLPVHKALLSNGILIVEGLANLNLLKESVDYFFVAAPMKLKGCSGAPVRAFVVTL